MELTGEPWRFEAAHREGSSTSSACTARAANASASKWAYGLTACSSREYPLAERDVRPAGCGRWLLDTEVAGYAGVGRFVAGLLDDVRVVDSPGLVSYLRAIISQPMPPIARMCHKLSHEGRFFCTVKQKKRRFMGMLYTICCRHCGARFEHFAAAGCAYAPRPVAGYVETHHPIRCPGLSAPAQRHGRGSSPGRCRSCGSPVGEPHGMASRGVERDGGLRRPFARGGASCVGPRGLRTDGIRRSRCKNGPGSAAETEKFVSLKNVLTGKPMGTPVAGSMLRILRLRISTATPCGSRDLAGQRVVLYFYPKDNTSGCTLEALSLRDGREELERRGFRIVGVSPDGERSHRNFCDKHALGFTLLSDPDHSVCEAYGVWAEKSMYGRKYMGVVRTTFLIDAAGRIERVIAKVDTKNHARQILDLIGAGE